MSVCEYDIVCVSVSMSEYARTKIFRGCTKFFRESCKRNFAEESFVNACIPPTNMILFAKNTLTVTSMNFAKVFSYMLHNNTLTCTL